MRLNSPVIDLHILSRKHSLHFPQLLLLVLHFFGVCFPPPLSPAAVSLLLLLWLDFSFSFLSFFFVGQMRFELWVALFLPHRTSPPLPSPGCQHHCQRCWRGSELEGSGDESAESHKQEEPLRWKVLPMVTARGWETSLPLPLDHMNPYWLPIMAEA